MAVGRTKDGTIYFSVEYQKDVYGNKGRKKQESKRWKTLKEAKEAEEEFLKSVSFTNITFKRLYALYRENKSVSVKPATLRNMDIHYVYFDVFYDKPINTITKLMISNWQSELLKKGLSNGYINSIQTLLKAMFEFAVKYDLMDKSPFITDIVRDKSVRKKEVNAITEEEFRRFIANIEGIDKVAFFTLLYQTGLRVSEALGLRILDYDGTSLRLNQQYVRKELDSLKTENSYRVIRLPNEAKRLLDELLQCYVVDDRDCLIFGDLDGFSYTALLNNCKQASKKAGLRVTPHTLRHSHATYLLHLGFDYVDIAKRLGDNVNTIISTYGHTYGDSDQRMVDAINKKCT